jgi:hypothetical protein
MSFKNYNGLEFGFCLRLLVASTQFGPVFGEVNWLYLLAQLRRFYLKTETEFSLRNVVLKKLAGR